jgi:hypothetical protein
VLGYLNVDFAFRDRPTVNAYLGIVLKRLRDAWQISHYQISLRG